MNVTGLCAKIASRLFVLATRRSAQFTQRSPSEEIIRISPLASGTLMPTCPRKIAPNSSCSAKTQYRVTMAVRHLGWVDSDLWSSFGSQADTVDINCQAAWWNTPKLCQPNPGLTPPCHPVPSYYIFLLNSVTHIRIELQYIHF